MTFFNTGCNQKVDIKGFDEAAWQQDARACKDRRATLIPALKTAIPQFLGLTHNEVIQVLGKPEGNSLEKSGERVYYYFLEPGSQCNNQAKDKGDRVLIRFDALDRVYKIRLENDF